MKIKLKKISIVLASLIITFIGFIYYASNDPITYKSLSSKNSIYISLRYKLLTEFFRNYLAENHFNNIDVFDLKFTNKDLNHISAIQKVIPKQKYFNGNKKSYDSYKKINSWNTSKLSFNGHKSINMKWKSHGRFPYYLHSNGFRNLSLNIKLNEGHFINGSNHFRLITHKRLGANMKINEYFAKNFNVICRKHSLCKVIKSDNNPTLYWFEDRLDNDFSKKINKPSLIIFSKKDEKSHIISNDTNIFELEKSLKKILSKQPYNKNITDSILHYYKNLNNTLYHNLYNSINNYFNEEYITSYMAARMLGGCSGHGLHKRNFFVYFDTTNFKFYPVLSRDESFETLKSSDSLEYYFDDLDISFFNNNLFRNDQLRHITYNKVHDFITKNEDQFIKDINGIYDRFEARYFPKWIKSMQGLTHLNTLPYFYTNIDSIRSHLSKSDPEFKFNKVLKNLEISICPNSFSALKIIDLKIKCNKPFATFNIKVNQGLNDLDIGCVEANKDGEISLFKKLNQFLFFDKLNNELAIEKVCSVITLEPFDSVNFSNKVSFKIMNTITKKYYISNK